MTWLQRYRVRNYVRSSIWIPPLLGLAVAFCVNQFVFWLDRRMALESSVDPGAARELLETLAASIFTLIVFVSSALLLAVQLASAQLTPRVISFVFKDPVTKTALALFVFSFTFALMVAVRIGDAVPAIAARIAVYCCLGCVAFFLYLIDHVGKFLRPSGVLGAVFRMGRRVIESVYPRRFDGVAETSWTPPEHVGAEPARTIVSRKGGVVLALDVRGLTSLAERYDCVIELVPRVGDFVAVDEPLLRIHGGGAALPNAPLYNSVAVGAERTIEQDPAYAFRIMVDIASKGLSPAINDPTTAVLAIDQIHRLLRMVGMRRLDEGQVRNASGRLRLAYPTPDWEDFVRLAVTEIRQFGATSIQVARRLRAMLENLIQTLPAARAEALQHELEKLNRSAERFFPEPEDRALAEVSDSQGVGGKHEPRPAAAG